MSIATLAGLSVSRAVVRVPAWGVPWIDCDLPDPGETALSGAQSFTIGGVSIACSKASGGIVDGRGAYRLVGGRGGWARTVAADAWTDDSGVKVATVLRATANAAGETLGALPTTRVGPHYARANALASAVLHELAPRGWYVDFAGVTQIGARPVSAYTGPGVRLRVDRAAGVIELATEDVTGLVPGVTIDGSEPATDIEFELDAKRLTARVYTGTRPARRLAAWARIFEALDPRARYRGTYEFRVVTQEGERLNLQPVRAGSGFSDLPRVPVRLPPGVRATFFLGSLVLVQFVDADPSRPVVVAGEAPDSPGWMPLFLELGGPGALPVARATDPVIAGPFAGTVVGIPSSRIKAAV